MSFIRNTALLAILLVACIAQTAAADSSAPSASTTEPSLDATPNFTCGGGPVMYAAPVLSGTGLPGNTLTASPGGWQDCSGVAISITYNWNGGSHGSGNTYSVQSDDVGRVISATITASDVNGTASPVTTNSITIASPGGPPPPPSDSQAPTMPGSLRSTSSTSTSVTVAWNASSDNVGVSGYGLYLTGNKLGTTTQTSYTFSGLTCAASYTVGVDAFDAVGNRSQQASIIITAGACGSPPPPVDTSILDVTATSAGLADSTNSGDYLRGLLSGNVCRGFTFWTKFMHIGILLWEWDVEVHYCVIPGPASSWVAKVVSVNGIVDYARSKHWPWAEDTGSFSYKVWGTGTYTAHVFAKASFTGCIQQSINICNHKQPYFQVAINASPRVWTEMAGQP